MEVTFDALKGLAPDGLLIVLVLLGFQIFGRSKIEAHFNAELEKHKHALQVLSESLRFEYEQKLRGFDLWTTKAFEVQSQLFSLLVCAVEDVASMLRSERDDLSKLDSDGAERYLHLLDDEVHDLESIIAFWYADRESAINQVEAQLLKTREERARVSLRAASAFFTANELYLSPGVALSVRDMLQTLRTMSVHRTLPEHLNPESGYHALANLRTVLRQATIDQILQGGASGLSTGGERARNAEEKRSPEKKGKVWLPALWPRGN